MDLHVLGIEGSSVVLDIQWLQQLGSVTHNYVNQYMEYMCDGRKVQLRGDPTTATLLVSFNQLRAMAQHDVIDQKGLSLLLKPNPEPDEPNNPISQMNLKHCPSQFHSILHQYNHLFQLSKGLSPRCDSDHRIHFFLTTTPINVKSLPSISETRNDETGF